MAKKTKLELTNVGFAFDHPEGVAWGPDGRAYAGGEAGQLYRFSLEGGVSRRSLASKAAFSLVLRMTRRGNTYACDDRSRCVHRITPNGDVSVYARRQRGTADARPELSRIRRQRQSLRLGLRDMGCARRLHLEGRAGRDEGRDLGAAQASGFTNGMCLSADGRFLYVVEVLPSP